jgi:protein-L-isoaspartate O-methyltransferase
VGGASQRLTLVRRTDSGIAETTLEGVRFVPLVREDEEPLGEGQPTHPDDEQA